jgi:uncharacterized protein YdaU (DUF1376 family)
MTKRPWMPLYVADYLADTLDLTTEQHGTYLLLLAIAWRRPDGTLPNDMPWLKRSLSSCVSDMHGNRFNKIVPALLERFFTLNAEGNWQNKRLTSEREKAEKLSENQSEKANKRWAETNKNNDLPDATAMPSHTHSQSQRGGGEARDLAFSIATEIGKLCGHPTPHDWPPGFCGAPHTVEKWLNEGWGEPIILSAVRESLGRKRDGPPSSVNYFEQPIARAHARHSAPLPKVEITDAAVGSGSKPGSWQGSRDAFRAARADLKAGIAAAESSGIDGGESSGPPLRLVAPTGRG